MNIIFSLLLIILIILLFTVFAAWLDRFNSKHKETFIAKAIDKVSAIVAGNIQSVLDKQEEAMDQYKTDPWYLVVYTQENNIPIWISNNNIRSIHPDLKNRKIIVKQFNGEDMVIEHVENYELCAANEMCDYDM